jgi:AraC family transcriptional regulator, ethanolamine operon transcriptional activator
MGEAATSPSFEDSSAIHVHDVDDLNHAVSGSNLELVQLKPGFFDAALRQVSFGDFSIDQGTINLPVRATGSLDPRRYGMGIFPPGARATWNGHRIDPSQLLFYMPGRELSGFASAGYSWTSLVIPRDWVESIAQTSWRSNMLQLRNDCRMFRPDASKLADLWHAVNCFVTNRQVPANALESANWVATDVRNALGAGLSSLDVAPVKVTSRALAHYSVARRAERYMRDRMAEPLCVDEICVALHVSRRYLEYAFTDAFGTSPSRYLRLIRLHEVRRRLKSLGGSTTVTNEALSLGFSHLSLFSVQYKRAFGESPSTTLAWGGKPGR